jgi:hypothetical protein
MNAWRETDELVGRRMQDDREGEGAYLTALLFV